MWLYRFRPPQQRIARRANDGPSSQVAFHARQTTLERFLRDQVQRRKGPGAVGAGVVQQVGVLYRRLVELLETGGCHVGAQGVDPRVARQLVRDGLGKVGRERLAVADDPFRVGDGAGSSSRGEDTVCLAVVRSVIGDVVDGVDREEQVEGVVSKVELLGAALS